MTEKTHKKHCRANLGFVCCCVEKQELSDDELNVIGSLIFAKQHGCKLDGLESYERLTNQRKDVS